MSSSGDNARRLVTPRRETVYRINVGQEKLMAAASELPNYVRARVGDRKVHKSTACHWAVQGVRGLRLPTVRIGGRLLTLEAAFSWWANQVAENCIEDAAEENGSGHVSEVLKRAGIRAE